MKFGLILVFCFVNCSFIYSQNRTIEIDKGSQSISLILDSPIGKFNQYLTTKDVNKAFLGVNANYLFNPFYRQNIVSKVLIGPEISILKFGHDPILDNSANIYTDYSISKFNILARYRPSLDINKLNPFFDIFGGLRRVSSKISEAYDEENIEVLDRLKSSSFNYGFGIGSSFLIPNQNNKTRFIDFAIRLNAGSAIKIIDRKSVGLINNQIAYNTYTNNYSNLEFVISLTGFR